MKASQFAAFLAKFALQLREFRAYEHANGVSELAAFFQKLPSKATVDSTLKTLAKIDLWSLPQEGSLESGISALRLANLTLQDFAKPALVKDIHATISAFDQYKRASLTELLASLEALASKQKTRGKNQPIREDLVSLYNARLSQALHNEMEFENY